MEVCNLIRKRPVSWWDKRPPTVSYCSSQAPFAIRKPLALLLTWIAFIFLLNFSVVNSLEASEAKVLIVKSGSASVYNRVINATRSRINHTCKSKSTKCVKPSISIESIQNNTKLQSIVQDKEWDLIVTIGSKAATELNSYNTQIPILYSLIPSYSYPAIKNTSTSRQKSAIYIDQPIRRQLQLIKSAMPGRNKIGVLLGKYSGIGKERLENIMQDMELKPIVMHANSDNIGTVLKSIYPKINVLLALPDPTVHNKQTVLKVLLSSYRHKVPVVGFSAAYVKSGATVGVYSTPDDIGRDIGDELSRHFSSPRKELAPPSYPRYFSVGVNRSVANSLNIRMPSRNTIKTRIIKAAQ